MFQAIRLEILLNRLTFGSIHFWILQERLEIFAFRLNGNGNRLRVPFCKNQTNFKFRGKGRKFDFAHILMVDSLGYDKNYCRVFLAKYPFISKKYANYQSPVKSPFDAPFY